MPTDKKMTSLTAVFNVALPEDQARRFLENVLLYGVLRFDEDCMISEHYIVESCDITGSLKNG